MFFHEIIESLEYQRENYKENKYKELCEVLLNKTKTMVRISLPEFSKVKDLFKFKYEDVVFGFQKNYIKLPYDEIWFEYIYDGDFKDNVIRARKISIMTGRMSENTFQIILLFKTVDNINIYRDHNPWIIMPLSFIVSEKMTFGELPEDEKIWLISKPLQNIWHKKLNSRYFIPYPLLEIKKKKIIKIYQECLEDLAFLNLCIVLLNIKNKFLKEIQAPNKLNKKRALKGKRPILSYKKLKVIVPSNIHSSNNHHKNQYYNRIHFCRGHFKEYTEQKPLFGKYIGLYWWQPHIRGKNKKGMVLKDYEVNLRTDNPLPITHNSENPKDFQ